jgi:hypothetical protein
MNSLARAGAFMLQDLDNNKEPRVLPVQVVDLLTGNN